MRQDERDPPLILAAVPSIQRVERSAVASQRYRDSGGRGHTFLEFEDDPIIPAQGPMGGVGLPQYTFHFKTLFLLLFPVDLRHTDAVTPCPGSGDRSPGVTADHEVDLTALDRALHDCMACSENLVGSDQGRRWSRDRVLVEKLPQVRAGTLPQWIFVEEHAIAELDRGNTQVFQLWLHRGCGPCPLLRSLPCRRDQLADGGDSCIDELPDLFVVAGIDR